MEEGPGALGVGSAAPHPFFGLSQVRELNDTQFPHTFLVSGKQRTLELQARSEEEMNAWIKAFQDAIDRKEKRSESFKTVHGLETGTSELKTEELGRRAPQWVRDNLVTMCMRCKEPFNAITRRRHHCRACGYVVCGRCSDYKAELQYDGNRLNRVCLECYVFLTGHVVLEDREGKHRGILEKGAAEVSGRSLLCSSLQLLDKNGKGSTRGWFVIPQDDPLVLYIYAAPQVRPGLASVCTGTSQCARPLPLTAVSALGRMSEPTPPSRCWATK
uniref:FYVE, RhoGEF and PH domain-containing protein 2 n=1 Tax=Calidris pygmaea TaxID=425635 RepID=A0A8C3KST6_9CHAR